MPPAAVCLAGRLQATNRNLPWLSFIAISQNVACIDAAMRAVTPRGLRCARRGSNCWIGIATLAQTSKASSNPARPAPGTAGLAAILT